MPLTDMQLKFVTKYLGFRPGPDMAATAPRAGDRPSRPGPADPSAQAWKAAFQAWLDANGVLDGQLNALRQAVLNETAHPELAADLQDIARVGLNALTGNHRVRLMGALQVMRAGDAESLRKHGPKALTAIAAFRAYLDANEAVDACEGNPWDVDVSIRDTLYPPLDRLTGIIASVSAP